MSDRRAPTGLFAFAVFAVFMYGLYWIVVRVLERLSAVSTDTGKAIITAGATVLVAAVSVVLGKAWEQRVRLRDEVRQRKLPVYESQIAALFSVLLSSHKRTTEADPSAHTAEKPEVDLLSAFQTFTEKIVIWGGPQVIKTWVEFRLHDWSKEDLKKGLLRFEAFVLAVRSELGNSNVGLTKGDILRLFINDLDVAKLTAAAHDDSASRSASDDRPPNDAK